MTPTHDPESGPPRWLTVLIIVVATIVLVGLVALHLSGAFGPGLHGG